MAKDRDPAFTEGVLMTGLHAKPGNGIATRALKSPAVVRARKKDIEQIKPAQGAAIVHRRTKAMVMAQEADKTVIINAVAEFLADIVIVRPADVLIGCYERDEQTDIDGGMIKTAGGLYVPAKSLGEDKFQGCSGLILKMGPLAFTDDAAAKIKWGETVPKVGDWVAYDVRETRSRDINGKRCRLMNESAIDMILPRPDIVW